MLAQQLQAQTVMSAASQADTMACRIYVGSIGYDLNEQMISQVRGDVCVARPAPWLSSHFPPFSLPPFSLLQTFAAFGAITKIDMPIVSVVADCVAFRRCSTPYLLAYRRRGLDGQEDEIAQTKLRDMQNHPPPLGVALRLSFRLPVALFFRM